MRLKIIHTNDVHSHYENFAKAATVMKQLKDENTLILDGGDFADFKSIELQGTRGLAAIELLQNIGYDALTIGNNEMFNGIETLEYMASSSPIPFISNNLMKKEGTKIQGVHQSVILEKNGLRILITGSSPDLGEFNDGLGVKISSYEDSIKEEIERNKGQYDLCLLLSHVGTFADEPLAAKIPEIDLIISAHDHKLFKEAKIIEGTIINSAGNYGEHVGIVEIEVIDGRIQLLHSETLPTADVEPDPKIMDLLKANKAKAVAVLSEPLYQLEYPLWHDVLEENPISNLIADGLRDMMGCEIGLINSGIVNAGAFGHLSRKKLIEICPSPLNPTSFDIKGSDLLAAVEQSLDAQSCLADGRGPGFRGKFVGSLHLSGAEVLHDGSRIEEIRIQGEALEPERWYSVASSDYLQRGSGYPSLAHNRNVKYRAEEIKDVIRLYGKQRQFTEHAQEKRWKIGSKTIV